MTSQSLLIEIGQSSFKALDGEEGIELPLERLENGRLTDPCRERVAHTLRGFLANHRRSRARALCAIGARGVSLRRMMLPPANNDEFERLLLLQIESEFPLAPDELAWGYYQQRNGHPRSAGAPSGEETIIVAVKKEVLEEYSEVLAGSGLNPVFTLAAWARSFVCPRPPGTYAVLDIGRSHSELITFELGAPTGIRILPWGGEAITRAIEKNLSISHNEAEKLKIDLSQASGSNGQLTEKIEPSLQAEIESLASRINRNQIGQKLYLTGKTARIKEIAPRLAKAIGHGVECESIDSLLGEGRSAAILGLRSVVENNGGHPPLTLQVQKPKAAQGKARSNSWQWAALACVLAIGSFSLRYAEALVWSPRVAKRLAELKSSKEGLPKIDRELGFLQYLDTNQPPYLNAIAILATSAAPGTRIESISMSRRGDLSLRAKMQNPQLAMDFRSKLIESGFFTSVVLEEQAPSPDRQVVVRMTAQWKPGSAREAFTTELPRAGTDKSKPSGPVMNPGMPGPMDVPAMPVMEMPGGAVPMMVPAPGGAEPAIKRSRISSPERPGASLRRTSNSWLTDYSIFGGRTEKSTLKEKTRT